MAELQCKICNLRTDTAGLPTGWRKMWIDCFGQLFASADLHRGVTGLTGMVAVEEATVCGQYHFLTLSERYVERGTFEPAEHSQPELALEAAPETITP
jgi:hypothetical protein